MDLIACPNCNAHVIPNPGGTCPSCQAAIPQGVGTLVIHSTEPAVYSMAVEEFTYEISWKALILARAAAYAIFALVMFGLGLFFVFTSGGLVWLFFFLALIGAIVAWLQYKKANAYFVQLSGDAIQVGNVRVGWEEIVKMETHLTESDMATGEKAAIRLTTRQGISLSLPAVTDNLLYIKKFIEDHAKNLK